MTAVITPSAKSATTAKTRPTTAAAGGSQERGVTFPSVGGTRSTSDLGRQVVADALRDADPAAAEAAGLEANWRKGYLRHFRSLVEAGLASRQDALTVADSGLASLRSRMRYIHSDGTETGLDELFDAAPADPTAELRTVTVVGEGKAERELAVPYCGESLRGDALARQLDAWAATGVVEPSCAEAVRVVAANPDWLDLSDRRVVVLGAAAEMGPLRALLSWGGDVVALDLPRATIWHRLLETGRGLAGRLHLPVRADAPVVGQGIQGSQGIQVDLDADGATLAEHAGTDLVRELPQIAKWLRGLDGPLVLGNYVYAHGATNVRVSTAVDALTQRLLDERDDVSLAFLATPTDVFAVPSDAVAHSERVFVGRSLLAKVHRVISGGRLLHRAYPPGADPAVNDSLVPQQGPNYALAKRLQRWRATLAREAGTPVSFKVAPPTKTRSVVSNRALAAAYAGAHRFGVEVFEPATSNTLMAALLVHDLRAGTPTGEHPWHDEAFGAAHGGLWRVGYAPRSALTLAALLGLPAASRR